MLSVIIVDYNSLEDTIEYIKSVENMMIIKGSLNFIIVDNYAVDGASPQQLNESFIPVDNKKILEMNVFRYHYNNCNVVYVQAGGNVGYARGNNIGIKISKEIYNDDYFLISNNDIVIPQKINFDIFIDIFDTKKNIAVIGPQIIGLDGKPQSPHKKVSAFNFLVKKYWSMATHNLVPWDNDLDYSNENKICYRVMGSFMIIKSNCIYDAGLFDENTFMYAEEMILSERLENKGYYTYFYNDVVVIHNHGKTVNKTKDMSLPLRWSFDSIYYYYLRYRKTSHIILMLGKLNFNLFILMYKIKKKL